MTNINGNYYHIDADHTSQAYTFRDTPVQVHTRPDGAFAIHLTLGCSKTYESEWAAIVGLFSDHGCTNIRVSEHESGT